MPDRWTRWRRPPRRPASRAGLHRAPGARPPLAGRRGSSDARSVRRAALRRGRHQPDPAAHLPLRARRAANCPGSLTTTVAPLQMGRRFPARQAGLVTQCSAFDPADGRAASLVVARRRHPQSSAFSSPAACPQSSPQCEVELRRTGRPTNRTSPFARAPAVHPTSHRPDRRCSCDVKRAQGAPNRFDADAAESSHRGRSSSRVPGSDAQAAPASCLPARCSAPSVRAPLAHDDDLLFGNRRFHERDVGARLAIELGATTRLVNPSSARTSVPRQSTSLDRPGPRPRHESSRPSLRPAPWTSLRDDHNASERSDLDLYCTRSSALEPAHRVPNIDRITETCVGVDDQWCLNNAADGLDVEHVSGKDSRPISGTPK